MRSHHRHVPLLAGPNGTLRVQDTGVTPDSIWQRFERRRAQLQSRSLKNSPRYSRAAYLIIPHHLHHVAEINSYLSGAASSECPSSTPFYRSRVAALANSGAPLWPYAPSHGCPPRHRWSPPFRQPLMGSFIYACALQRVDRHQLDGVCRPIGGGQVRDGW